MEKCTLAKRILLFTMSLPLLAFIPYKPLEFTKNVYYTTATTVVASYIFLINFPIIIQMSHTRPLNFSDLEDDKYVDPGIRKDFKWLSSSLFRFSALSSSLEWSTITCFATGKPLFPSLKFWECLEDLSLY